MKKNSYLLRRIIEKKIMNILLLPLRCFPVKKDRVLLISWMGYRYSGNPKYIAEHLISNYSLKVYYAVKKNMDRYQKEHKNIRFIKFGSIKYFYMALTCKVFITDGGGVSYIPFKKNQYLINTWHGGGAYKKCGLDVLGDSLLVRYDIKSDSKKYNLYLSTCKRFTEAFSKAQLIPESVFKEIGMPRNDVLLHPDQDLYNKTKKKLKLEGKKIVLYAPTFRDYSEDLYEWSAVKMDINVNEVLQALKTKFGGEWIFLWRGHPNLSEKQIVDDSKAKDVSEYDEMQELLLIADVLINDYSSSMWDFALMKKPCFIFAPDIERYKENRDFYTPISEWPFPIACTNAEITKKIQNFDNEIYLLNLSKHFKNLGICESGKATETIGKIINEVCKK